MILHLKVTLINYLFFKNLNMKSNLKVFNSISKAIQYAYNSRVNYDVCELERVLVSKSICDMNKTMFIVDEQNILG